MVENEIEFEIIKVYEKSGILRVMTECKYGKDDLGLSLEQKYINPVTNEPKFLDEVRELLFKKYKGAVEKEVEELKSFKGMKFKTRG